MPRQARIPGESVRPPKQTRKAGEPIETEEEAPAHKQAEFYDQYGPESLLPAGTACNAQGQKCAEGEVPTHRIGTIHTEHGLLIGRPVPIR